MQISHPNTQNLTEQEQQQLENLQSVIEKAIADGVLTRAELNQIYGVLQRDHKVTPQELELIRTLLREKTERGELVFDGSFDSLW